LPPGTEGAQRVDALEEEPQPASQSGSDEDVPHRNGEVVGKASGIKNPRRAPLRFHEENEVGEEGDENASSPEKIVTGTVSDALGFHGGGKLGANSRKYNYREAGFL
jgi:hypothetical protein